MKTRNAFVYLSDSVPTYLYIYYKGTHIDTVHNYNKICNTTCYR